MKDLRERCERLAGIKSPRPSVEALEAFALQIRNETLEEVKTIVVSKIQEHGSEGSGLAHDEWADFYNQLEAIALDASERPGQQRKQETRKTKKGYESQNQAGHAVPEGIKDE